MGATHLFHLVSCYQLLYKKVFCLVALIRFKMLKQWVADPSLSSITVEEKYHTFVENLRTDRYVTVMFSKLCFRSDWMLAYVDQQNASANGIAT